MSATGDGVETTSFLDASDGLVNMFGEYRNKSTGPTSKPIPSKRPAWYRSVFLCPGRSTSQHRGAVLSSLSGRLSTPIDHCNRNRGSGPAIRPINRYPPRLRCWLRARPRKVRGKVPPVSSASYGMCPTFHCLSRTSHEFSCAQRSPVHLSSAGIYASRSHF